MPRPVSGFFTRHIYGEPNVKALMALCPSKTWTVVRRYDYSGFLELG